VDRSADRRVEAREILIADIVHEKEGAAKIGPLHRLGLAGKGGMTRGSDSGELARDELDAPPRLALERPRDDREIDLVLRERVVRAPRRLEHDIDRDARMRGFELREHARQPVVGRVAARRDPKWRPRVAFEVEDLLFERGERAEKSIRGSDHAKTGWRRHHLLSDPIEEPRSESALEIQKLMAHRRLR